MSEARKLRKQAEAYDEEKTAFMQQAKNQVRSLHVLTSQTSFDME